MLDCNSILFLQSLRVYLQPQLHLIVDEILQELLKVRDQNEQGAIIQELPSSSITPVILQEEEIKPIPALKKEQLKPLFNDDVQLDFELASKDRQLLFEYAIRLKHNDSDILWDSILEIKDMIFNDFPPHVFFVYPEMLKGLLSLLFTTDETRKLEQLVLECVSVLIRRLCASEEEMKKVANSSMAMRIMVHTFPILKSKDTASVSRAVYLLKLCIPMVKQVLSIDLRQMVTLLEEIFLFFNFETIEWNSQVVIIASMLLEILSVIPEKQVCCTFMCNLFIFL